MGDNDTKSDAPSRKRSRSVAEEGSGPQNGSQKYSMDLCAIANQK